MKLNAGGLSSLVVGREKEIEILKSYINFSQHTVIMAPRRYGKTTLANKVLDELKNEYLIVKVDIFQATNIKELCERYLNAIYKSVGIANFLNEVKQSVLSFIDKFSLSYEIEGIKIGYEIFRENDENKFIEKTFNFANTFAKLHKKKMLVFFDEFGDIEKFDQNFIKKIRSYMQTHENIVYLFAGSQTSVINTIFLKKENAFFNFASLMKIGFLDKKEAEKFLKSVRIDGKVFNKKVIESIYDITKFHPFYMIKLMQESFISSLLEKNKTIRVNDVDNALKKILNDNNAFFETTWQQINRKRYKGSIYKQFCQGKTQINNIDINSSYKSQLIKELKMESLLSDELNPTDPFLGLWLTKRNQNV